MTAAHQMKVYMKNDLPTAAVDVGHQAVAAVSDTTLTGQPIGHKRDSTQPHRISWLDVQEGWYVSLWHDEEMDWCAGINVLYGQQGVILVEFDPWLSAGDDVAKDAFRHQPTQWAPSSLAWGLGVPAAWLFLDTSHGVL
jgi:hypothetical protein